MTNAIETVLAMSALIMVSVVNVRMTTLVKHAIAAGYYYVTLCQLCVKHNIQQASRAEQAEAEGLLSLITSAQGGGGGGNNDADGVRDKNGHIKVNMNPILFCSKDPRQPSFLICPSIFKSASKSVLKKVRSAEFLGSLCLVKRTAASSQ